jgi:heterodisulfide reductase subunit A-like polyferredoxin
MIIRAEKLNLLSVFLKQIVFYAVFSEILKLKEIKMTHKRKVVIIGAGIGGITTAVYLAKKG